MALKDDKFRVATHFSAKQVSEPLKMKIVSSVLYDFAKTLVQFYPHEGVTKGHLVSNYFSENFEPWYTENFPHLASDKTITVLLRNKTQSWFRTLLKQLHEKIGRRNEGERKK